MLFIDPFFLLVFLPFSLALFFLIARCLGRDPALALLFVASCLFYAKWGVFFLGLMLVGTFVNFFAGASIIYLNGQRPGLGLAILVFGQAYNFGTLAYFKYFGGFLGLLGFGDASTSSLAAAAIPIGISFYTFQQAVFLMDAWHLDASVKGYLDDLGTWRSNGRALVRYGAFHCFFPQLVIGPIIYLSEFAPQVMRNSFGRPRRLDFEVGLTLATIGLFKKLVLADNLALIADPVFNAAYGDVVLQPGQAWIGVLAYYVQLYFDFSGYSDMALGIARLVGIRLPANFDSPLRATGIVDFYRRWHLSLTRVIARFLFTPISLWGSRRTASLPPRSFQRRLVAIWLPFLINFEIIALWHGAVTTFVIFGLVHGGWYIAETEIRATKFWRKYKRNNTDLSRRIRGQLVTFLPLMLTFALFRCKNLDAFVIVLKSLFFGHAAEIVQVSIQSRPLRWIPLAFAIVWLMPNAYEFTRRYRPAIRILNNESMTPEALRFVWRPNLFWAVIMTAVASISVIYINRESVFIYMGF